MELLGLCYNTIKESSFYTNIAFERSNFNDTNIAIIF